MATSKKSSPETAPETAQETVINPPLTAEAPQVPEGQPDGVPEAAELALTGCYVTGRGGLNLREAPDMNARVVAVLPFGVGVWADMPINDEPGWVRVETGILSGWVRAEFLAPVPVPELEPTDGAE